MKRWAHTFLGTTIKDVFRASERSATGSWSRLTLLLLLVTLPFAGIKASSLAPINVCYGESLGPEWNKKFEELILGIFTQSGIDVIIKPAPTRRSHTMVKQDQCEVFTSVSRDEELYSTDYLRVREGLFDVELNIYTHPNQPFIYQQNSRGFFENLSQLDNETLTTGYFRTGDLDKYFSNFKKGETLSLNLFEQGIRLLKIKRIQFFITPITPYLKHEIMDNTDEIIYVDTLFKSTISLFLHSSLIAHQPHIEASIRKLRKERFSPLLQ